MSNRQDHASVNESGTIGASAHVCDRIHWNVSGKLEKYWGPAADVRAGLVEPYEVLHTTGNVLLRGGADLLWQGLISTAGVTATTGAKNTAFNNANAVILVGDSNTAAVNTQVDLQASSASTDREILPMEATYPQHTTGDGSTANLNVVFRGVATTAMANFAWNEWGIGNSTSSTAPFKGRMINRKVQSLGTKSTAATWTLTVTLSLA